MYIIYNIRTHIIFIIVYTEILIFTGKQEEDLVSCNQKVNMMSLEVMEANKKYQDAMKRTKSLEEQCVRLREEKQELTEQ